MDVAHPFGALLPGVDSAVLSVLTETTMPRTGREIALRAHRSPNGVRAVLERLVAQGLVDRKPAGRAFVYTLNRDHLAAPSIETLAALRPALMDRLRQEIGTWRVAPVHASLFGSAARGDGDADSDIDLLMIRPAQIDEDDRSWREQVDELGDAVRRWTGNHAAIVELSEDQIPSLAERGPSIIDDLRADAIPLAGPGIGTILRRA